MRTCPTITLNKHSSISSVQFICVLYFRNRKVVVLDKAVQIWILICTFFIWKSILNRCKYLFLKLLNYSGWEQCNYIWAAKEYYSMYIQNKQNRQFKSIHKARIHKVWSTVITGRIVSWLVSLDFFQILFEREIQNILLLFERWEKLESLFLVR